MVGERGFEVWAREGEWGCCVDFWKGRGMVYVLRLMYGIVLGQVARK